jgi:hypothetical protein
MKKEFQNITLGLILCLTSSLSISQSVSLDFARERSLMSNDLNSKIIADGTPYIDENFSLVRIRQYKEKLYNARYNAFNGELEVKIETDKVIVLDRKTDFEVVFTLTNKTYRAVDYINEKSISKRGFLVVFSEDKNYSLFKEEHIQYFEKVEATSSYQQDKPARFKRDDDVYYLKLDDKVTFVPQNKKDFIKAFPEQSKKLKSYMKENKLNPKKEDELLTLVKYLSTIIG